MFLHRIPQEYRNRISCWVILFASLLKNSISSKSPEIPIMKIKEAIILAGGLGTRLRSTVPDLPKCMAPVAGKPFLFYVINYYRSQEIEKFIFSLGYKHEQIEYFLQQQFPALTYE